MQMDRLMKPAEAASVLDIPLRALHRLCRLGDIAYVRINNKEKRFTDSHLEEYVQRRTESARVIAHEPRAPSWRRPSSPRARGSQEASVEDFLEKMKDL